MPEQIHGHWQHQTTKRLRSKVMKTEREFQAWVNLVLWRAVEFQDIDENLIHSPIYLKEK